MDSLTAQFDDQIAQYAEIDRGLRRSIAAAAMETEREPTPAQKEAGNYAKGAFMLRGLRIVIENAAGSFRRGVSKDGRAWSQRMPFHYGYLSAWERHGVQKSAADEDHLDVFVGPDPESELVFVVDQQNADGRFDEHKLLVGFNNEAEARAAYLASYSPGWTGLKAITPMTWPQFRAWAEKGDTGRPVAMYAIACAFDDAMAQYGIKPATGQRSMFDEEKHPRDEAGKFTDAHHAVAKRFKIPVAAVKSIVETPVAELRKRDEYVPRSGNLTPAKGFEDHPLGTAKLPDFGEPANSYVDFMHEFHPKDLTNTEPEDMIKNHESYEKYLEWAKAGIQPPPINVVESDNTGNYLSHNRRRTLAAQDAGVKSIKGWLNVKNHETGNPLKYGDVLKAHAEASKPTKSPEKSTPASMPDGELKDAIRKLPSAERQSSPLWNEYERRCGTTIASQAKANAVPKPPEEKPHLSGYEKTLGQLAAGKLTKALHANVNYKGTVVSRKLLIDKLTGEGWRVDKSQSGEKRLVSPHGTFLDSRSLTSGGIEYAQWRLNRSQEAAAYSLTAAFDDCFAQYAVKPAKGQSSMFGFDAEPAKPKSHSGTFDPAKHPRGQPENAGEFVKAAEQVKAKPKPTRDAAIAALRESSANFRRLEEAVEDDRKTLANVSDSAALKAFDRMVNEKHQAMLADSGKDGAEPEKKPEPVAEAPAEVEPPPSELPPDEQIGEPVTVPKQALPKLFADAIDEQIADFGEKIEGARKHQAKPLGPRGAKVETEKDDRPAWQRRYRVAQDAKKPGEFFIVDERRDGGWRGNRNIILDQGPMGKVNFKSREAAEKAIPLYDVARTHAVGALGKGTDNLDYVIYRKVADRKHPVVKRGFKSYEEAEKYMALNANEIIEHKFPRFETYRYLDHVDRNGPEQRKGDVTPGDFQKAFNFRGGQFGNWNMGKDGQTSLNHAYDGLHDLADAIGLPAKATALNGDLAIAFGARGTGGKGSAAAHYEPDNKVINLTKMNGAGTLAHEWGHAFDAYMGRLAGTRGFYLSGHSYGETKLRPEVAHAIQGVKDAIATREVVSVGEVDREQKTHDSQLKHLGEYVGRLEEAFRPDAYRKPKPFTAAQQKEWDATKAKIMDGDFGKKIHVESKSKFSKMGGYQSYENLEKLNKLYKESTGRSFHTTDDKSTGNYMYWQMFRVGNAEKALKDAQSGIEKKSRGRSNFMNESLNLDQTQVGDYYSEPEEMFARAFEAYVQDKLDSQDRKSQYLVARTHNKHYAMLGMKPYPEGDERTSINAAFDKLFETIKHEKRSDDKGDHVRLYSLADAFGESIAQYASLFRDEDHPRGQAENSGEFRKKDSAPQAGPKKPTKKPAAEQDQLFATSDQGTLFGQQAPRVGTLETKQPEKRPDDKQPVEKEDERGRFLTYGSAIDPSGNWKRFEEIPDGSTMALYHATSRKNAESILKNGWDPAAAKKQSAFTDSPPDYVYLGGKEGLGTYIGHQGKGDPVLLVFRVQKSNIEPDKGSDWKSHAKQFKDDIKRFHGKDAVSNPSAAVTYAAINQVRAHHSDAEPIGYLDPMGKTSSSPDGWTFIPKESGKTESPADAFTVKQAAPLPAQKAMFSYHDAFADTCARYGIDCDPADEFTPTAQYGLATIFSALMGRQIKHQPQAAPARSMTHQERLAAQHQQTRQRREQERQEDRQKREAERQETRKQRQAEKDQERKQRDAEKAQRDAAKAPKGGPPVSAPGKPAVPSGMSPEMHDESRGVLLAMGHKPKEVDQLLEKLGQNGKKYETMQDVLREVYKAPNKAVERTVPEGTFRPHEAPPAKSGASGSKPEAKSEPSHEKPRTGSGRDRWITIGAKNHHGGTPVKIDGDGDITAGPKALKGENVSDLPDREETQPPEQPKRKALPGWDDFQKQQREKESGHEPDNKADTASGSDADSGRSGVSGQGSGQNPATSGQPAQPKAEPAPAPRNWKTGLHPMHHANIQAIAGRQGIKPEDVPTDKMDEIKRQIRKDVQPAKAFHDNWQKPAAATESTETPESNRENGATPATGHPSAHNPDISYHNPEDRDSDDKHFSTEIAKARAEVEAAKKELAETHDKHAEHIRKVEKLQTDLKLYEDHAADLKRQVDEHRAAREKLQQEYSAKFDNPTQERRAKSAAKGQGTRAGHVGELNVYRSAEAHGVSRKDLSDAVDREIQKDDEHWQNLNDLAGHFRLTPTQRTALREGDVTSLKGHGDFEETREQAEQLGMDFDEVMEAVKNGMPPKPSAADAEYVDRVARELAQQGPAERGEADESDLPAAQATEDDDKVPFSLAGRDAVLRLGSHFSRAFYSYRDSLLTRHGIAS